MQKPELLAPAGSFEKAKIAFLYGADAIYCGTSSLSLRSRAAINDDDLFKTIVWNSVESQYSDISILKGFSKWFISKHSIFIVL